MATVARVNGSNTQVGTLYNANANLYIITVKNASNTAIDLQTEDSYGANAVVGGVIEAIVDEINPLAWYCPADANGQIHIVVDKPINSAAELQVRIRRIGKLANSTVTSIGPHTVDISGTVVTAATSFIVS